MLAAYTPPPTLTDVDSDTRQHHQFTVLTAQLTALGVAFGEDYLDAVAKQPYGRLFQVSCTGSRGAARALCAPLAPPPRTMAAIARGAATARGASAAATARRRRGARRGRPQRRVQVRVRRGRKRPPAQPAAGGDARAVRHETRDPAPRGAQRTPKRAWGPPCGACGRSWLPRGAPLLPLQFLHVVPQRPVYLVVAPRLSGGGLRGALACPWWPECMSSMHRCQRQDQQHAARRTPDRRRATRKIIGHDDCWARPGCARLLRTRRRSMCRRLGMHSCGEEPFARDAVSAPPRSSETSVNPKSSLACLREVQGHSVPAG